MIELKSADLSVLSPINAYKSVISLFLGIIRLGELPTWLGVSGILLIVNGSCFIIDKSSESTQNKGIACFFRNQGIQFRFEGLVFSATEVIFPKNSTVALFSD